MKKLLLFLCIILLLSLMLSGCDIEDWNDEWNDDWEEETIDYPTTQTTTGKMYSMFSLMDSGVEVFKGIAPQGWYADITSNWNMVDHIYPGLETVALYSPDYSARLILFSIHSYVDNSAYAEGVNYDYYTTYLHKMNASEYIAYYISCYYNGATLLEAKEVPADLVNQLEAYNQMRVTLGQQDMQTMNLQSYNLSGSIRNDGVTAAKELYTLGDKYIELSTGVAACTTSLISGYSSLLNNVATNWEMPYLIIYEADSKENFDKYYDDYNFIVANSSFTTDFYAMNEYVSSVIDNQYTAYYAAKSQAALDAANAYIDSNYSSTSSQSTQEKVREMWDDYIKDVDSYKLEDGSTFKTSIFNETVAQNGNEIYVGDKAGIPLGFNEVAKGY